MREDDAVPIEFPKLGSGKIRDLYVVDDGHLLLVASDRISAYDWVLPTEIPDKGRVLTALSAWWFEELADVVANHLVSAASPPVPEEVAGRAMLVQRLRMIPVECVVRGYVAGSAVGPGCAEGDKLPAPIFTPTTKAAVGAHDEPMSFEEVVDTVGADLAEALRERSLAVYGQAAAIALTRGLILADTKLEFGVSGDGSLVLGDEVLTPDSSRYWSAADWAPGQRQASYDKQYVRDWLTAESGWDRTSGVPPPELPPYVVTGTRERYLAAYELLTGTRLALPS
ncbi:MAG: phosphoribosylaminoimidazolesuccinocarboxamide synthase [Actinomycetota bacterium]|nr:phosphoribosylaminoimidazolesuccinocarboxamide synthase [Actinomycetota bacterium]